MNQLISVNHSPILVGQAGCGKTQIIKGLLTEICSKSDTYQQQIINFNFYSDANLAQMILEQNLEKKAGRLYAPKGTGKLIYFVDDLNMPKPYLRSQPPIEILRQLVDQGGWYDRKDNKHPFRNIVDTMIVAAMGTPGGGKSFITPRFQRHFNILHSCEEI